MLSQYPTNECLTKITEVLEKVKIKMAGEHKAMQSFDVTLNCRNAIQWSADNRLSISTDSSILIMCLLYSPSQLESTPCFHCTSIPASTEPNNMLGVSGEQFLEMQEQAACIEDKHEIALDRTLCPLLQSSQSSTGYRCVRWSPLGCDPLNRCLLGALTYDHKLCIYSTGETLYTWKQVACLSDQYSSQDNKRVNKIDTLKVKANKLSAMDLGWSSCFHGDGNTDRCLLCAGMKNGDLVLWKIKLPANTIEDCEVLKVHRFKSSCPSAITWTQLPNSKTDGLVVGYSSGEVHISMVNLEDGGVVSELYLHGDEDAMEVSCLCTQVLSTDKVLVLATKEVYLMFYVVSVDARQKLALHLQSHVVVETMLYVTGLCLEDNTVCITTQDAQVLTGQVTVTDKDVTVQLSPIPVKHPPEGDTWSCQGGDLSANSMFWAVAMSRQGHCFSKHPIARKPVKVHIIQLQNSDTLQDKFERILQNDQVSFHSLADVLEMFREHLWMGKNLTPCITKYITKPEIWHSLPLHILRMLRFFLITIKLHIPNPESAEKSEECAVAERNIRNVTEMIIGKYVSLSLENLLNQNEQPTNMDRLIAGGMMNWMVSHTDSFKDTPLMSSLGEVKQMIEESTHLSCAICGERCELSEELDVHCKNEHHFGMCCQTLRSCDTPGYRVCVICKAQAVPYRMRKDYKWLADSTHHCTLCGGLIA